MSKELAIVELDKWQLATIRRDLNSPPRDTFRRHNPDWKGELDADKQRDNDLYDAWLKSLKPGDVVYYDSWYGYSSSRQFTTVRSTTKTGMIRLEDDTLVDKNGKVKGGKSSYKSLQPFTEAYELHNKRNKTLYNLNKMDFDHLTNEGLVLVLHAIQQAEAMLTKLLKPSEI